MPEKSFKERDEETKSAKIWIKKLNKFFRDYYNWIIVSIVIFIFIFGFLFLLLPKYSQTVRYINIFNQQEELDVQAKKNELAQIRDSLSAYDSISAKYIDKIEAIAPSVNNKEELFSEINYLISRNQLSLQSISLSEISSFSGSGLLPVSGNALVENLQEVSMNLSVSGVSNYEVFKGFLVSLENNLHLMDVTSLNFSPGGESIYLIIKTYYSKE